MTSNSQQKPEYIYSLATRGPGKDYYVRYPNPDGTHNVLQTHDRITAFVRHQQNEGAVISCRDIIYGDWMPLDEHDREPGPPIIVNAAYVRDKIEGFDITADDVADTASHIMCQIDDILEACFIEKMEEYLDNRQYDD